MAMDEPGDMDRALMLDGNAVAGLLEEVFGGDMTAEASQCAHCGNVGEGGSLLAFTHGPGAVLRCSVCKEVVVRIVRTETATYVDARGAAYLRMPGTTRPATGPTGSSRAG
jgi:Family of unknown function (DUF6510)